METKNIQLINAEEVSFLFQTKYNSSSFIRVLSGEEQINLATATSSTNEIIKGDKIEIEIGSYYVIELDDYSSEIELELKNLGWGLLLFINEDPYYLRVNRTAQKSEFSAIKNYPTLKFFDFNLNKAIKSLDCLVGLTNLTTLNLSRCRSLTSLKGISSLTNLTSLDLNGCESLTSIDGISGLSNLTILGLGFCDSLTNLSAISGLTNLTSLNLKGYRALSNLEGISRLTNLTSLILGYCSSLTSLEGISGLTNLSCLSLNSCAYLKSLEGISSLSNLEELDLGMCSSLTSLEGISGLTNLTSLNLGMCSSLTSLDGISSLTNLTFLFLSECKPIIFIKKLNFLTILEKLYLTNCSNIRDFEELIHCPNLKEVTWIHEASCSYVLIGSAVRRKDQLFIEEKIEGWINDLQFAKNPIVFAKELIAAVSLIEKEELAKVQFIHLAKAMRERGLADGESGYAFSVTTWELWAEAVMKQTEVFQEIVERSIQNINAAREIEVVVAPIITALADIPIMYPTSKEWALTFVEELLEPFKDNEDWARTIAPAAAVFFAGFELQEEVKFWLDKGTHPYLPKWRDNISLALVSYYAQKAAYSKARIYLKEISLPDVQDQGRVVLATAMSAHFPKEALEEFVAIKDVILQTDLAKQLALEPNILVSSEGLYQILLCLEQTPELFSEFVANVLETQPNTKFVDSIEALFSKPVESNGISTEFISLCENPEVLQFVAQRKIDKLKQELQDGSIEERALLLNSFVSLLVDKKILDEEDSKELQLTLVTKQ